MANQMSDDERLARELQAAEFQQQQSQPQQAFVMGQGNATGMPVAYPVAQGHTAGTFVQGNVVQGSVVQGSVPPGTSLNNATLQPGAAAPGVTPGVIGIPYGSGYGAGHDQPYAVTMVADVSPAEATVLNYRMSLKCFTCVDCFSTVLNAMSSIQASIAEDEHSDQERQGGMLGSLDKDGKFSQVLAIASLVLIIGPICGFLGARNLNRGLVQVYLIFCVIKTSFELLMALLTPFLWFLIIALIQVWVTKIVYTFWKALGEIGEELLERMRNPDYVPEATPRIVVW
eukprot:TRINITY_DN86244_c0_g1_i1.p1 TRINITY_DN86244_c0_g1~~TRINITY_DN86244_c0_g1_i1.p1  ORF type:complete len:306 (-),score=28.47 TRINITY_DN86244_c0_g1_i1:42-899(-)